MSKYPSFSDPLLYNKKFFMDFLTRILWNPNIVLICISLMAKNVEYSSVIVAKNVMRVTNHTLMIRIKV